MQALSCPWVIFPFDSLVSLNFSRNDARELPCGILGLRKLKIFDCTGCNLDSISPELTKRTNLPNIEQLLLANNRLGALAQKDSSLLHELTELKRLDLSNNGIEEFSYSMFKNLHKLEKLDLSLNKLRVDKDLDINVSQFINLKLLDLSRNQFTQFSPTMIFSIEEIQRISPAFTLKISDNPFECSCDSIPFLRWIESTKANILEKHTLLCEDKKTKLLEVNLQKLQKQCDTTTTFIITIISLTILSLLAMILGLAVYTYRWRLAWHIYIMRRRFNLCHKPAIRDDEFELQNKQFDAFVAYATEDDIGRRWMKNILLPHLEDYLGKRLHIFDRDTQVGNSRIGELIDGMKHSKHTIFILTNDFLRYYEWEMVLYWAVRRGLDSIIFCCIGGFKIERMPPALGKVAIELQEKYPTHYLEFPAEHQIDKDNHCFVDIL